MANYVSTHTGAEIDAAVDAAIHFEAVYGSTTYAEIKAAFDAGRTVSARKGFQRFQLANLVAAAISFSLANAGTKTITLLTVTNADAWSEVTLDLDELIATAENGEKPLLIAGNAEQILSTERLNDKTPYTFRETAGGATVGNSEFDSIVGGTVAWNQLANRSITTQTKDDITFTANADGTVTANGTASADGFVSIGSWDSGIPDGHVLLFSGLPSVGSATTYYYELALVYWTSIYAPKIWKKTGEPSDHSFRFRYKTGTAFNNAIISAQCHDLTQMFGTTIADYIYSLDQNTAGAGIAWLQNHGYFTQDYYAYDTGSLQSVCAAAHVITGVNLYNGKIAIYANATPITLKRGVYTISAQSTLANGNWYISGKKSDNTYCTAAELGVPTFAESSTPNVFYGLITEQSLTFNIPVDGVTVQIGKLNATNTISAQINIGTTALPYEPYVAPTIYPLDSSLTLRGLPKLDANNKLYYDGEKYTADGTVTRRYNVIDMGTLNWGYNSTQDFFTVSISGNKYQAPLIAVGYVYVGGKSDTAMATVANMSIADNGGVWLKVKNTSYTDAAAFKVAMSGVMLQYELATPTAETATPYASPQSIANGGTEEYTDAGVEAGTRDVAIPAGHDTDYTLDITGAIERVIGQVPEPPTANGTYTLKVTVSGGAATYSWA